MKDDWDSLSNLQKISAIAIALDYDGLRYGCNEDCHEGQESEDKEWIPCPECVSLIPDYINDGNAMIEAIRIAKEKEWFIDKCREDYDEWSVVLYSRKKTVRIESEDKPGTFYDSQSVLACGSTLPDTIAHAIYLALRV